MEKPTTRIAASGRRAAEESRPAACAAPGPRPEPSKRLPPLIALSYLEAAARTESFAAAGKLLHVSPAAISQQVKALEALLGVRLFDRHHRKVVPTAAARAALPRLQEGFAALAEAVDQMRAHGQDQAVVTVCAEPLFATKWLVPRLHRFYARCPEAELRLQASLSSVDAGPDRSVAPANFQRAGIDLSIRLGHGRYPGLHATPLRRLTLVPVCAPALLPRLPAPQALLTVPLLTDSTLLRSGEPLGWREWLQMAGVAVIGALREQRFGNGLLALEAAVTGQGVLLASPELTQAEREAGKLAIPFDLPLRGGLAYHLVCPESALERAIVRAFRDWILEDMGASGEPLQGAAP